MADNANSAVNTVLLVLILIAVVLGLAWFFGALPMGARDDAPNEASIEVNLPTPENNGGDAGGQQQ